MTVTADPWGAFEYEVQMLHDTRAHLQNPDAIVHNAVVESFLLHTRILVEALVRQEKKYDDDVTIADLLPRDAWSHRLQDLLTRLRKAYGSRNQEGSPCCTLNKRLAHLTHIRGDHFVWSPVVNALDPLLRDALREVALLAGRPSLSQYCA